MKYYFYKCVDDDKIIALAKTNTETKESGYVEITEREYNEILQNIKSEAEAETEKKEKEKDELIEELQQENAALLYQILTGEELDDV